MKEEEKEEEEKEEGGEREVCVWKLMCQELTTLLLHIRGGSTTLYRTYGQKLCSK